MTLIRREFLQLIAGAVGAPTLAVWPAPTAPPTASSSAAASRAGSSPPETAAPRGSSGKGRLDSRGAVAWLVHGTDGAADVVRTPERRTRASGPGQAVRGWRPRPAAPRPTTGPQGRSSVAGSVTARR